MADAKTAGRTDGFGRSFVCEARSPEGWHVEVFGPNEHCNFVYAYARHPGHGAWSFGLGCEPASAEQIGFRWIYRTAHGAFSLTESAGRFSHIDPPCEHDRTGSIAGAVRMRGRIPMRRFASRAPNGVVNPVAPRALSSRTKQLRPNYTFEQPDGSRAFAIGCST